MEFFKKFFFSIMNQQKNEIKRINKDIENLNKSISSFILEDNVAILKNRIKQLEKRKKILLKLGKINEKIIEKFDLDNKKVKNNKAEEKSGTSCIKCNNTKKNKNADGIITIGDKIELPKGEYCLTATNGYNYQLNESQNANKNYFIDSIAAVDCKKKKVIKIYSQKGLTDKKIREELTNYYGFNLTEFKLVYHLLYEDKRPKGWVKNVINKEISKNIIVPYKDRKIQKNRLLDIEINK